MMGRGVGTPGFTLVEVLVVMTILALLAGLVGPRIFRSLDVANVRTAEVQVKNLRSALETYRLDVGQFPSTTEGLIALMSPPSDVEPGWNGPYLDDAVPVDPWNRPYVYESPAETPHGFALYSLGADGTEGGEGHNADVGYL